jgi:hypothetical protein
MFSGKQILWLLLAGLSPRDGFRFARIYGLNMSFRSRRHLADSIVKSQYFSRKSPSQFDKSEK